jgi:hypothetical protein
MYLLTYLRTSWTIPRHSIPYFLRRAIKPYSILWCNLTVVWTIGSVGRSGLG